MFEESGCAELSALMAVRRFSCGRSRDAGAPSRAKRAFTASRRSGVKLSRCRPGRKPRGPVDAARGADRCVRSSMVKSPRRPPCAAICRSKRMQQIAAGRSGDAPRCCTRIRLRLATCPTPGAVPQIRVSAERHPASEEEEPINAVWRSGLRKSSRREWFVLSISTEFALSKRRARTPPVRELQFS
jgi:hypothetical protein